MSRIRRLATALILPLPPAGIAMLLTVLIPAWMLYCLAYATLDGGAAVILAALGSAISVAVPWVAAFEIGKRLSRHRLLAAAALIVASLAASLTIERGAEALIPAMQAAPLSLMVLRRAPAWLLLLLLWALAERRRFIETVASDELPIAASVIDWVSAADNYVEIHVGARTITHRMTMHRVERLLPDAEFARIHRSILVRRDRIRAIRRDASGEKIQLLDGSELPVGSRYRRNLQTAAS